MFDGCDDVQSMTDNVLKYLPDKEATESASVVTQDKLSKMVESLLKTANNVKSAKGKMKLLSVECKSVLQFKGLN